MAEIQLPNGISATSTTSGTSDFVLSGVQPWSSPLARMVDGKTYVYFAHYDDLSTTGYERGVGVWSSGSNTLTRATVLESSASPNTAKVGFSGATLRVSMVAPSEALTSHVNAFPGKDIFEPLLLVFLYQSNGIGLATESPMVVNMDVDDQVFDFQRSWPTSPEEDYSFKVADPGRTDAGFLASPLPFAGIPFTGMIGEDSGNLPWFMSRELRQDYLRPVYMVGIGISGAGREFFDPTTSPQGSVFLEAETRVNEALTILQATWPNIRVDMLGIIQGESDRDEAPALWSAVWRAVQDQASWFTAGYTQTLVFGHADNLGYWGGQARLIQETDDRTRYVPSDGIDGYDGLHFDVPGLLELAKRGSLALAAGPKDKTQQVRDADFIDWTEAAEYDPGAETVTSPENQQSGAVSGYRFNIPRALTNPYSTVVEWLVNSVAKVRFYVDGLIEAGGLSFDLAATDFTSPPAPRIDMRQSHTYDYYSGPFGMELPAALMFGGTHTLLRGGNILGTSTLFGNRMVMTNGSESPQNNISVGAFATTAAQVTLRADNGTVTLILQYDHVSNPTIEGVNGGAYNITNYNQFYSRMTVGSGVNITARRGHLVEDFDVSSPLGTVTGQAGYVVGNLSNATNNSGVVIGQTTIPVGNWGVYQGNTRPNRFGGGMHYPLRTVTGATATLSTADHILVSSGATGKTIELPDITAVTAGLMFVLYESGTGGATLAGTTSKSPTDPIIGPTAPAAQYGALYIVADTANSQWITWQC